MTLSQCPKTVLCIHDLPGYGRAALSVIVPVLSTLGLQAVALPTAVLSTHTGGLGTPAKLSNPGYGPAALAHYQRLGVRFDAIYSGYLADPSQAHLVEQAFSLWPQALKLVDPVLGDGGQLYRSLGPEMVSAMKGLCARADLILPNLTEAALLLEEPMPADASPRTAEPWVIRLTELCPRVVLTGVSSGRCIGALGAERGGGSFLVKAPLQPRMYHGTGDIFGAVFLGRLLCGNVPQAAAQAAAAFVAECIRLTPPDADERLGVWLESALPQLTIRTEP